MAKEEYASINLLVDRLYRHPILKNINKETIIDYVVDFMRIVGVPRMFEDKTYTITTKDYRAMLPDDLVSIKTVYNPNTKSSLRYTDSISQRGELTYKVQGNVIYTTSPSVTLEVHYRSIPVDEEGIPKIPDNASFLRAVEAYIKKNYFTILVETGKMHPSILQNAQQEYAWAVGDCETEFKRLSFDEATSFYRMWKNIFVTKPKA